MIDLYVDIVCNGDLLFYEWNEVDAERVDGSILLDQ